MTVGDLVVTVRVRVGIALWRLGDLIIGRRLLAEADRLRYPSDYPLEPERDERRTW